MLQAEIALLQGDEKLYPQSLHFFYIYIMLKMKQKKQQCITSETSWFHTVCIEIKAKLMQTLCFYVNLSSNISHFKLSFLFHTCSIYSL